MEKSLFFAYAFTLAALGLMGAHRLLLLYYSWRGRKAAVRDEAWEPIPVAQSDESLPRLAVQLPIFNERYVAERLVRAVGAFDYPADRLEIQILDDSTDDTTKILANLTEELRGLGLDIQHIRRDSRVGFKAGALDEGMRRTEAEFVAIFDADFIPEPDWPRRVVEVMQSDPTIGMVQTRWRHLNSDAGLLTRLQGIFLDGHFAVEHRARESVGCFFNFNGTAGMWRRAAIEDAGGWNAETLTEDLDLSYRAQLKGWRFVYRDDIRVPSELPEEMNAYRQQQQRWSKGASQVLRRLGASILLSPRATLHQKFEAMAHLTANFSYVLMLCLSILIFPIMVLRRQYDLNFVAWLDAGVFLFGTMSVAAFFFHAQRANGSSRLASISTLPLLMSFGIGMSFNNARAVLSGLLGINSAFQRTAKYGAIAPDRLSRNEQSPSRKSAGWPPWAGKDYVTRGWSLAAVEAVIALYCFGALAYAIYHGVWQSVPFLLLFVVGYSICVSFSALQLLAIRRNRRALDPQLERSPVASR